MNNKHKLYNYNVKKVTVKDYTYYRIQKSVNKHKFDVRANTKKEVEEKYLELIEKTFNSDLVINKMTFEQFVNYYLFDVVLQAKSVKTLLLQDMKHFTEFT